MRAQLKDDLLFYRAYHQNKYNVLLHMICVPVVLFQTLRLLSFVVNWRFGFTELTVAIYSIFYLYLHIPVGVISTILLIGSDYAIRSGLVATSVKVTWISWVVTWLLQFLSHSVFEGRKPALFDSFFQSLFTAPFFVLFEYLFLLGFYRELRIELDETFDTKLIQDDEETASA
ncbi:2-hydroxy-palmitic acid dioxygenase MPO1 Ecym_7232 [Eremothecium cymbalariae DBVPG|uniref:DUF962 domain protein n=1 Tax=Eremothecium cymbalariae (strain CBS 270.75 / DBVPG 7215 / KCTC 17166 / NRRL Y-17582) TaxID=931890 RepID=G8JW63_ERECY|nr:hypothetical protein Ecym_7232 [Eremothecium cymbalariae DBVPG\